MLFYRILKRLMLHKSDLILELKYNIRAQLDLDLCYINQNLNIMTLDLILDAISGAQSLRGKLMYLIGVF
jgi:hypothetical protein